VTLRLVELLLVPSALVVLVALRRGGGAVTAVWSCRRARLGPLSFVALSVLLLLNQLVFQLHVLGVAPGSDFRGPPFPPWWFRTVDVAPALAEAVGRAPAGVRQVLGLSWLRVNAVLETPFALAAAATAARYVSKPLHDLLLGPRIGSVTAIAFTAVLAAVSHAMQNPWTGQDIALRWVSCLLVCGALLTVRRRGDLSAATAAVPTTLTAWVVAVLGAGFFVGVVLCVVWITLLYNLADLAWLWPFVALGTAGALVAARAQSGGESAGARPRVRVLGAISVVFCAGFIPVSLPVRYLWPRPAAVAVLVGLVGVAVGTGIATEAREAPAAQRGARLRDGLQRAAVGAGLAAASWVAPLPWRGVLDIQLAAAAVAAIAGWLLTPAWPRANGRRGRSV